MNITRREVGASLGALAASAAIGELQTAGVGVRVAPYYMRIAPSIYNDLHDVERLLEVLS
jgi:selenocysteine lyase/cysteine desulfurase